jgi:hypothetical protein
MPSKPTESPDKEIVKVFEAAGVVDYLQYLQSSKKILWTNFKAGLARGFGITVGMTLVVAVFIWILTKLISLPVIGEYFNEAQKFVQEYAEKTNYSEEFEEMNGLLREIRDNTRK